MTLNSRINFEYANSVIEIFVHELFMNTFKLLILIFTVINVSYTNTINVMAQKKHTYKHKNVIVIPNLFMNKFKIKNTINNIPLKFFF